MTPSEATLSFSPKIHTFMKVQPSQKSILMRFGLVSLRTFDLPLRGLYSREQNFAGTYFRRNFDYFVRPNFHQFRKFLNF